MNYPLLKKYWSTEELFPFENRSQFHNAFVGALSALVDANIWDTALETAKASVVQNLKVKAGATD